MECPKCGSILGNVPIIKIRGGNRRKTLGNNKFCTNMNCRYEKYEKNNGRHKNR